MRLGFARAALIAICAAAPLTECSRTSEAAVGEQNRSTPRLARQSDSPDLHDIKRLFSRRAVPYPAPRLYLRAFKREGVLELWAGARRAKDARLQLIKLYPICARSGRLGPKRREGDLQVPEGFYQISYLRRHTRYHRGLLVSYPNRSDRLLGAKGKLGGAIYIHGKCVTIGCLPLRDRPVEQLFNIVRATRRRYGGRIPIHLFPARMDDEGMRFLRRYARRDRELLAFWLGLRPAYRAFEKTHRVPAVSVNRRGRYRVRTPSTRRP